MHPDDQRARSGCARSGRRSSARSAASVSGVIGLAEQLHYLNGYSLGERTPRDLRHLRPQPVDRLRCPALCEVGSRWSEVGSEALLQFLPWRPQWVGPSRLGSDVLAGVPRCESPCGGGD